jgi:hypothetical protein
VTRNPRAFRAIVGPADVPEGKATWTRPGTFRTPYALVAAWGLPPSERTGFTKQYRSAGFRVGSLGYVTGSGHSNWVSVAAILRSHAAAVSYIDGMHDFYVAGIGYSVIGDGSSSHAFRLIQRDTGHRIISVTIYAMRGDLVVLLQQASGSDQSAVQVQLVMRLLLARSAQ